MRKLFAHWNRFVSKLGFKRHARRSKFLKPGLGRGLRYEPLEVRQDGKGDKSNYWVQ